VPEGFTRAGKEDALNDEEIKELLRRENEQFKKLDEEHKSLKSLLAEMDRKVYLSADEEMERKKLQKLKLSKKDRMAELIREYRKSHTN
jgi:uncharacterized protein YdcH (DUF465 family)